MRNPTLQRRHRNAGVKPALSCRAHGDVHIFKDQPRCDTPAAVGRLHQVVSGLTPVFPPERVDEDQGFGKLSGFDQESGAVDFPCSRRFSHVSFTHRGEGRMKRHIRLNDCRFQLLLSPAKPLCRRRDLFVNDCCMRLDESTRVRGRGQFPKFGASEEKLGARFVANVKIKKNAAEVRFFQIRCGSGCGFKAGRAVRRDWPGSFPQRTHRKCRKTVRSFSFSVLS